MAGTPGPTVTRDIAPHLTATRLTTLINTPAALLTVAELEDLRDALTRVEGGSDPAVPLFIALGATPPEPPQ